MQTIECPYCREQVPAGSTICKFCNEALNPSRVQTSPGMIECPFCREEVSASSRFCKFCNENLDSRGSGSLGSPGSPVSSHVIQAELKKWNWGAFLWGPIWAIGNNTWIGLLGFIPYVGLIMAIVLGIKGNEWAWQNKNWNSFQHFKETQKKWVKAWFITFLVIFTLCILIGLAAATSSRGGG